MINIFNHNELFSKQVIDLVWEKATKISGYDPDIYRKDKYGSWITKNMYSETNENFYFGWGIDYLIPKSLGGTNDILNLEPKNWENINEDIEEYINNKHIVNA